MFQQTILAGRIGRKEIRYSANQKPVLNYSIVTTKSVKDKQTGQWTEKEEWHRLVSFNKCAEHINNNFQVGDVALIEGELETNKWQDQQGNDRYTTEIVVHDFPKKLPRYFTKNNTSGMHDGAQTSQKSSSVNMQSPPEYMNTGPSLDSYRDDIPM